MVPPQRYVIVIGSWGGNQKLSAVSNRRRSRNSGGMPSPIELCYLSWRIVLYDSTLYSSTCRVCDTPHRLITSAKSAASCARLLTSVQLQTAVLTRLQLNVCMSQHTSIKSPCSCRTAYTRSALKLLKANRQTGKRLLQTKGRTTPDV